MAASFLASFLVYAIVGIYTLSQVDLAIAGGDRVIKILVVVVLYANAIYYYYYAFHIEQHQDIQKVLRSLSKRHLEWLLRVCALSVLFSLWIMLQRSWGAFCWSLLALYILYILWDVYIVFKFTKMFYLLIGDGIGLLLALVLLNIEEPTKKAIFFLGMITICFSLLAIGGLVVGKLVYKFQHTIYLKSENIR